MSKVLSAFGIVAGLALATAYGCSTSTTGGNPGGSGGNGGASGDNGQGNGAGKGGGGGSGVAGMGGDGSGGGAGQASGGAVGTGGAVTGGTAGGGSDGNAAGGSSGNGGAAGSKPTLGFFITSANPGQGGDLKGLDGADAHCKTLATAVGAGGRLWRAYLGTDTVDPKSRIGNGPWLNVKGVEIAASVAELHGANSKFIKANVLTEKGVNPGRHDIMTGSGLDGTKVVGSNCANWTANTTAAKTMLGHYDRQGGGTNPTSWNSAHESQGCTMAALIATSGDGLFYCFAAD